MIRTRVAGALLSCLATTSPADDYIELAAGKANDGIDVLRIGWQQPWSSYWLRSDRGVLTGMHAFSLNRWSYRGESIESVAYSPLWIYRWFDNPVGYIKLGIGVAYLSDPRIGQRVLSTRFQFEDQLGIGWQWQQHDVSLVYMHYSNAGIEKPNQGMDMLLLSYAFRTD